MGDVLQAISSITWLMLAVIVFIRLRQWNKQFSELYEDLKAQLEDEE